MTFNVENLFDTIHDTGKKDQTYLPLSEKQKHKKRHEQDCAYFERDDWKKDCLELDWTETVFKAKIDALARVILSYKNPDQSDGPDVVLLQEIENKRALNLLKLKLNDNTKAKYITSSLIEGHDYRGIDVALISKLPLIGSPKLHEIKISGQIDEKKKRDIRGILQTNLKLPTGETLVAFALHFPSPAHPTSSREQALRVLSEITRSLPKNYLVVAGGDVNTPSQIPAEVALISETASKDWLVSHLIGCKDCKGTIYYPPKKVWSFFDVLFFSKNTSEGDPKSTPGLSPWVVDVQSIKVHQDPSQVSHDGIPIKFDPIKKTGVSDHLPMTAVLKKRQ